MTYIYNIIYVKTAYITHIAGKGEGVRGARRGLMWCFRRVQDIAPLKHFPAHTHTIKLKCVCWGGGGGGWIGHVGRGSAAAVAVAIAGGWRNGAGS